MKKWTAYAPRDHWLYRLEWAVVALIGLALLHWRSLQAGGLDVPATILLALIPDVVFLAILPAIPRTGKNAGKWPNWGSKLYNVAHTWLTWIALVGIGWHLTGSFYWPLLGYAFHLAVDRVIGFDLRKQ